MHFFRDDSYVKKFKSSFYGNAADGFGVSISSTPHILDSSLKSTGAAALVQEGEKLSLIKLASMIEVSSKKDTQDLNFQAKLMEQIGFVSVGFNGGTAEADRKRRHFGSISPIAVAAKKQLLLPTSEEKKHDAHVLQFQNQKLLEKLEALKVEYSAFLNKFIQLSNKQKAHDSTLKVVKKSWEGLISDLESRAIQTKEPGRQDVECAPNIEDGALSATEDAFLSRLMETGATESSSSSNCPVQMKENREQTASEKTGNILHNIVVSINDLWCLKGGLFAVVQKDFPSSDSCRQKAFSDLESEVENMRLAIGDIHLKHRTFARDLQSHRDIDAKNKAELKRIKGELESAVSELHESNCKLATLKAERDATKRAFYPVLNISGKLVAGDKVKDKHSDLQEMESALKMLLDQASTRVTELKGLHEEIIKTLQQLSDLQNTLKSIKCISSSQVYLLVGDQLEKSKSELSRYQELYEKLQVEKDNLGWREKQLSVKNDIADVFQRSLAISDSRASHMGAEIQRQIDKRKRFEAKLEEASREPGRKEIIAEFKSLLSSFPEEMSSMQSQLGKYKEDAVDIHSIRADMQSLSTTLDRKAKECENLSVKSSEQVAAINKLLATVQDLKDTDVELKLILDMHRHEITDSRDVLEVRDSEYKAWAHVQSLKSCLDEQNLELRVRTANEAEAISQQRLAAAEAEIAELRQKLEASRRNKAKLSDVLKSINEENEAYLSEIESIGQAYDDMQIQNQQLLQQITERDDYNIKLFVEGVKSKQLQDSLLFEKHTTEKEIQQASTTLDFYDTKAARVEDQLRFCSGQAQKLAEERFHNSVSLENTQKRLSDVGRSSHQARESLDDSQSKIEKSRVALVELQIELERQRFSKKRNEEELEGVRRKVLCLQAEIEGSSTVQRLQQELREDKEILKCSICLDRPKEVVITKCYHLFCNPCIQKIIGNRHCKCPVCAASFGANDVKPVYI